MMLLNVLTTKLASSNKTSASKICTEMLFVKNMGLFSLVLNKLQGKFGKNLLEPQNNSDSWLNHHKLFIYYKPKVIKFSGFIII